MQYICGIMALKKKKIKKKTILKKKIAKKSKSKTDKTILDEIIRVDHAGEYGATRIYDGQIAVFGKDSKIGKTIQHMADQEQEHIEKFNELPSLVKFLIWLRVQDSWLITYQLYNVLKIRS